MHDSPRIRRLRSDLAAMERLSEDSSVLRFQGTGQPVQHYRIEFRGKSLVRNRGKVTIREQHEVDIKLGSSYPRTMPELRWVTPIYHPNISEIGMVCLGGYGTHWVPSLSLDDLCVMLWDMTRYQNYDIRSPYNREAALWVANQTSFVFPLDTRPLRDLRAALGRVAPEPTVPAADAPARPAAPAAANGAKAVTSPVTKASKYADFVRRFASDLDAISSAARLNSGPSSPESPPRSEETETFILLDMEVNLRPRPPRPGPSEEIVFIE